MFSYNFQLIIIANRRLCFPKIQPPGKAALAGLHLHLTRRPDRPPAPERAPGRACGVKGGLAVALQPGESPMAKTLFKHFYKLRIDPALPRVNQPRRHADAGLPTTPTAQSAPNEISATWLSVLARTEYFSIAAPLIRFLK